MEKTKLKEKFVGAQGVLGDPAPKNLLNKKAGITLVALVITVIILLILAGAAVTIALNGDSIFGKANRSVTEWNSKVTEEESSLSANLTTLNTLIPDAPALPTGWNPDAIDDVITEEVTIGEDTIERSAPIPAGFKVSIYNDSIANETTIAGGLVIYETTSDLTQNATGTTTAHETAMANLNQYVWIPVDDINSMIMCKSSNTGDAGTISINGTPQSGTTTKCHIEFVDVEVNGETTKVLKCTNSAHSSNSTNLCGRLYTPTAPSPAYDTVSVGGSNKKAYKYNVNFTEDTQTWNTYSYHEPNTVNGNGSQYDAATSGAPTLTQLTDYFNYMAKSVATYHGFYVSRYEIGGTADSSGATVLTSRLGQVVFNAAAYSASGSPANPGGVNKWYGLYNACNLARASATDYSRGMIWGSQYDQILKFIDEDKAANAQKDAQIGHPANFSSVTWSNYYNTSTYSVADYPESGELGDPAMKNVYDLENNFNEWTLSAYSTNSRARRGGYFSSAAYSGSFHPASYRDYHSPTSTDYYRSSRAVLLVQL